MNKRRDLRLDVVAPALAVKNTKVTDVGMDQMPLVFFRNIRTQAVRDSGLAGRANVITAAFNGHQCGVGNS